MQRSIFNMGIGTLVNHFEEGDHPHHSHVMPIYQTSTFEFPDVATGAGIFSGQNEGYFYTRIDNPNMTQLGRKYAVLEGQDLLASQPEADVNSIVAGKVFSSGMAAITSTLLALAKAGDTIIVQKAIYGNTFVFLHEIASQLGINLVWVDDTAPDGWQEAFDRHPKAVLAYAESPVNPAMQVVDLKAVSDIAHRYGAWLVVDNTFATPYCQRPLTLGSDVVVHSTTKYLSGHGVIIGGTVISRHPDFISGALKENMRLFGGSPSPFDAWLANIGLKTFEIRMQRHCENAMKVARYLVSHPEVERVYYPGLENDPGHSLAKKQMSCFGGMLSFELKGGLKAGETLMNSVRIATLAVSLGMVDTLIEHPASMTHASVPREERLKAGITDGLVRYSVGIENIEDLIWDLEQGLKKIQ